MTSGNYYLHVDIEWSDSMSSLELSDIKILTSWNQSFCQTEIDKFNNPFFGYPHSHNPNEHGRREFHARHCNSITFKVQKGHNTFDLDIDNLLCNMVVMNFDCNAYISCGKLTTSNIKVPSVTFDKYTSQIRCPELGNVGKSTHIIHFGAVAKEIFQNKIFGGSLVLNNGTKLEFDSEEECTLHVTLIYHDLFVYVKPCKSNMFFISSMNETTDTEIGTTANRISNFVLGKDAERNVRATQQEDQRYSQLANKLRKTLGERR